MGEFKKSNGFRGGEPSRNFRSGGGDRPPFNKGGFGGGSRDRDGSRPRMFPATCAECNNSCEVPFNPGDRDVLCSNCFAASKGESVRSDSHKTFERRGSNFPAPKPQTEDKRIDELMRQVNDLHKKLNTIMEMINGAVAHKTAKETDKSMEEVKEVNKEVKKEIKEIKKEAKKETKEAVKKAPAKKKTK